MKLPFDWSITAPKHRTVLKSQLSLFDNRVKYRPDEMQVAAQCRVVFLNASLGTTVGSLVCRIYVVYTGWFF